MIRRLIAATLGLMVGMVLLASPAQAATQTKTQGGPSWDFRTCAKGGDNQGTCWLTYPDQDVRIWANDATHRVQWDFTTPSACNPSSGCTIDGYGWSVGGASACATADAFLQVWLFGVSTTVLEVVVNPNKDEQDRQCSVTSVWVRFRW